MGTSLILPGFARRVQSAENMPDRKYFLALALEARAVRDSKIEEGGGKPAPPPRLPVR